MSRLDFTHHAIEQFASRWRPESPEDEVEAEFRAIVQGAAATRKRTRNGDARIYVATSARGEQIELLVREDAIITVLPPGSGESGLVDHSIDVEIYEESRADLRAIQAKLAEERTRSLGEKQSKTTSKKKGRPEDERQESDEKSRQRNAKEVIHDWKNGRSFSRKALANAHRVLGLIFEEHAGAPIKDHEEENRRRNAEGVIRDWKSGHDFTRKALMGAHRTLGLIFEERGNVSIGDPATVSGATIRAMRELITEAAQHDSARRLPGMWQVRAERALVALDAFETGSRAIRMPEQTIAAIRSATAGALRELVAEAARHDSSQLLPHMWQARADLTLEAFAHEAKPHT